MNLYLEETWEELLGRVVGTERGKETLVDVMVESATLHERPTKLDGLVTEGTGDLKESLVVETEKRGATSVVMVGLETILEESDVVTRE